MIKVNTHKIKILEFINQFSRCIIIRKLNQRCKRCRYIWNTHTIYSILAFIWTICLKSWKLIALICQKRNCAMQKIHCFRSTRMQGLFPQDKKDSMLTFWSRLRKVFLYILAQTPKLTNSKSLKMLIARLLKQSRIPKIIKKIVKVDYLGQSQ